MYILELHKLLMASPSEVEDTACSSDGVLFVRFNQDYSSLSVGANSGFTIFNTSPVSNFETIYDNEGETRDVCIIERLFSSSLVAIVSMTTPRKLKVCHFQKGTEICTKFYFNQITAVRLNRQRVVVVLEDSLYIHGIKDMKILHTIRDTPSNPKGICAISTNSGTSFFAYPGNAVIGEVQVFDIVNFKAVVSISAHNGPLASLAFDLTGTKIATASVKGTVIRVFSIPEGQPLFDLRRGLKRYAEISCLTFSADSNFLCVSSNTETVHIFKLVGTTDKDTTDKDMTVTDGSGSWMGYFNTVVSYLPTQVSSVLNQDRAFATAKLPITGLKNICAMITLQKMQYVIVAGYNGFVYVYTMDSKNGGECELSRQHCVISGVCSQGKTSGDDLTSDLGPEGEAGSSTRDSAHVLFTNDNDRSDAIPFDTNTG